MQEVFTSLWFKCKTVSQPLTKWHNYQTKCEPTQTWSTRGKKNAKLNFVSPPTTSTGKTSNGRWLKFGEFGFVYGLLIIWLTRCRRKKESKQQFNSALWVRCCWCFGMKSGILIGTKSTMRGRNRRKKHSVYEVVSTWNLSQLCQMHFEWESNKMKSSRLCWTMQIRRMCQCAVYAWRYIWILRVMASTMNVRYMCSVHGHFWVPSPCVCTE